ncbi:MAG: DUF4249 domain-containing protein [Cyclobacteriaceae bacterium]|nr:DUF4249 domain-containing protein [Cyclobacteriaceae bacterium HetDA_MAG_MS6]
MKGISIHVTSSTLYLACFALVSCVDQLDTTFDNYDDALVVEASIHTGQGPYQVRLAKTSDTRLLINRYDVIEPSAKVYISDDMGRVDTLREIGNGWYETTSDLQGEVGRTYTLDITRSNGQSYRSSAETLPPPVNILGLTTEFEISCEPFNIIQGHRITAEIENTAEDHYIKLEANGIRESFVLDAPITRCWAFVSGLIKNPLVMSNIGVSQSSYPTDVLFLSFGTRGRYFLDVEALSLTEGAYLFWKSISDQLNQPEHIFAAPAQAIGGNITNIENPEEPVIGYFSAYSIRFDRICIDRTFLRSCVSLTVPNASGSSCTEIYAPAVVDPPYPTDLCE